MMNIKVFSKEGCSHCEKAKRILKEEGLEYESLMVESERNADANLYFSGTTDVPNIFANGFYLGNADDLETLKKSGRLKNLVESLPDQDLPLAELSDEKLAEGASDVVLGDKLLQNDGSRTDDEEAWAILRLYKEFFGFYPNTFQYLSNWSKAYKLFVYCQNFAAIDYGKRVLNMALMSAIGYSTSNAHGCTYCQTHSMATGGEESMTMVEMLNEARRGKADEKNPFGKFELALADVAKKATVNTNSDNFLEHVRGLADKSKTGVKDIDKAMDAVALITASFGFLNVFNDLTGLKIEGDWYNEANEKLGIDAGRHGVDDSNPNNLDYDLPEGGPTIKEMMGKYTAEVGDLEEYCRREFGVLPGWIKHYPQEIQSLQAYLYAETMNEREDSLISPELKHLMSYVSAVTKGNEYLAKIEAFITHHITSDKSRVNERIRNAYAAATGESAASEYFNERETAALRLAWLSAKVPLTTPKRFIEPVLEHFSGQEVIHLIVACSIASMIQRFAAIVKPETETETEKFFAETGLPNGLYMMRFPVLDKTNSATAT